MRGFICVTLSLVMLACEAGAARDDDSDAKAESDCMLTLPQAARGPCTPAYAPTFEQIFTRTLSTSCGTSRCHEPSFRAGGLSLTGSAEEAYANLLEVRAGGTNVRPGSPECSPLVHRLFSEDELYKMPRLGSISKAERCAIVQWIADGAEAP